MQDEQLMTSESIRAFSAILIALMPGMNTSEPNRMNRCTASIEPAIAVTVSDARTGSPLEATIFVEDGNFQEQLSFRGVTGASQIIYGGAFERPGVYTVKVSRSGYEGAVLRDIKVTKDECHVVTQNLTVALSPSTSK
jgi:hypothetical protein